MEIKEKVQKIEAYIDSILSTDMLQERVEEVLETDSYINDPNTPHKIIYIKKGDTELSIKLYCYPSFDYSDFTNDISEVLPIEEFLTIYVPSKDILLRNEMKFRTVEDEVYVYPSDLLSTETSLEELEEMIFNLVLQYGNTIDINKIIFTYVLYKKYIKVIPNNHEILVKYRDKQTLNEMYKKIGVL